MKPSDVLSAAFSVLVGLAVNTGMVMLSWGLFVTPVLGLPKLSFLQALGLVLFASLLRGDGLNKSKA